MVIKSQEVDIDNLKNVRVMCSGSTRRFGQNWHLNPKILGKVDLMSINGLMEGIQIDENNFVILESLQICNYKTLNTLPSDFLILKNNFLELDHPYIWYFKVK